MRLILLALAILGDSRYALAFGFAGVCAVVGALLAWGREAGADVAYLQVAATNLPAAALYARLGFGTAYTYAYSEVGRSPR